MDLRLYYQKIRDTQAKIAEPFPVVESCETPDGGIAGRLTEVTPAVAAKLIVEGVARLAKEADAAAFRDAQAKAKQAADEAMAAAKVQMTFLPMAEWNRIQDAGKRAKNQA
jgi:NADH dehydrogenase/NADH:ubiquinone oxidoreductase subunit G